MKVTKQINAGKRNNIIEKQRKKTETERIHEESKYLFSREAKTAARASDFIANSTREASNAASTRLSFLTLRREVPFVALPTNNLTPAVA